MQFSTVIGQFAYCLRLTVLHFCICHRLYTATRHICVTLIIHIRVDYI